MAITTVEYLLINGSRYAVYRDQFSRSHVPVEADQLAGKRVQSPFVDAETIGYEDGEGLKTVGEEATGYLAALGMEPVDETIPFSGHRRLKVGRALTDLLGAKSGWGGIADMIVFRNELWIAPIADNSVWSWDGSTLTEHDFSATATGNPNKFVIDERLDRLYIGTDAGGVIYWSGAAFALVLASSGYAMYPIGVFSSNTESILWMFGNKAADCVLLSRTIAGAASTVRMTWTGQEISCGFRSGSTIYVWLYDAGDTKQPRATLYSWNADTTGTLGQGLLHFDDNYPLTMAVYKGDIYLGMAWGGSVRKMTSTTASVEILHVGLATAPDTVPGTDAIYALRVFGDYLYAAGYTAGAASGQRTWLRRWDGTSWHLISAGGSDNSTAIRSLFPFQQTLCLGDSEASDARLVQLSKATRLTSAVLEGADAEFGAATVAKRFRVIAVRHTALVAGQKVDVRYKLDGGSEVTVGVNQDVGSTETVFELSNTVRGGSLRPLLYLTNTAAADLIVAGHKVRVVPAPQAQEVWTGTLSLRKRTTWESDASSDTIEAPTKFDTLAALRLTGQPFQVVEMLRENSLPLHAMLAVLDPQVPLEGPVQELKPSGVEIVLPARFLQASGPENLVKNASFEQDANGSAPTDWGTVIGAGTSALTDNGAAQDGTYSLKEIFSGAASYGRSQSVSGLSPGRYYTVSAYIRRTTWATALANPRVDVYEAGILTSGAEVGPGAGAATDAAFVRYSQTFLYPLTGSGTVLVRCFADGTPAAASTVLFDAVMLEEGVPVSTFRERGSGG